MVSCSFLIISKYFNFLEVYACRCTEEFLFLEFFLKKLREIVKTLILLKPSLSVHKSMIFTEHMFPNGLTSGEILGPLVITIDTQISNLDFFLKIL